VLVDAHVALLVLLLYGIYSLVVARPTGQVELRVGVKLFSSLRELAAGWGAVRHFAKSVYFAQFVLVLRPKDAVERPEQRRSASVVAGALLNGTACCGGGWQAVLDNRDRAGMVLFAIFLLKSR
jgi:hypothetical protein